MTSDDGPPPSTDRARGPGRTLTAQTVAGVRWTYARSAADQLLMLASTAVLARLLPPRAFGLVAMAGMAMTFIKYFAQMGLTRAMVQRPELRRAHVRAGMTSSLALGLVAYGVVWLAAPLAGVAFEEPDVVPVLRLLGLALVLSSAGMAAEALMERRLAFRALALRTIVANVLGLVTAIGFAVAGYGVFALVLATLVTTAVKSLLAYAYVRHDLRPILRAAPYRDLLAYGSRSSVIGFLEFLGHDLGTVLIGRWAGAGPLGLYNRAELLVRLPSQTIAMNLSKVLFPVFSVIQTQVERLRRAYLQAIEVTAAVVLPLCAGIAVAAPEIVAVVLGPQWSRSADLVPYLALAAAAQVVAHFGGVVCDARARLNQKLVLTSLKVLLLGLLLFVASRLDELLWFALAIATTEVAAFAGYAWLASRTLEMSWSRPLVVLFRPLVAAAMVAASIGAVSLALAAPAPGVGLVLGAQVVTGALALTVSVRWGPLRPTRNRLLGRLVAADVLRSTGRTWRLLTLVLGRPLHDDEARR